MCLGVMWRPDTSFTRWRRGPLSVGVHTRTKPQKLPKAHPEPLRQSSVSPNNQPHYGVRTPRSSARKLDRVCHYGKVTPAATHNSRPDAHTSSSRTASPAAHRSLQLFAQTRPLSRRRAPASGYTCAWPAARHGASVQPQPLYRLTPASSFSLRVDGDGGDDEALASVIRKRAQKMSSGAHLPSCVRVCGHIGPAAPSARHLTPPSHASRLGSRHRLVLH